MKVFVDRDKTDYLEIKNDGKGQIDLSIRTSTDLKSSLIITAKLNLEVVDKIIANLILLKSEIQSEK